MKHDDRANVGLWPMKLLCIDSPGGFKGFRYHGRHRGKYKPGFHWSHVKCYPSGTCHVSTRKVRWKPYFGSDGVVLFKGERDASQAIS